MKIDAAEEIRNLYFPVLDHGFVALKDYMGCDQDIAEAARCSYGHGTKQRSDDRGLIRYMVNHRHTSPLEMVEVKFHMKLPIFVARQLVRHRTANLNEYSGRYSLMPMLFYTPELENFCAQSETNKQGRKSWLELTEVEQNAMRALHERSVLDWHHSRAHVAHQYEQLVNAGLARELSRIDLPLSTYTEWYWKCDVHNLFHFLGLRSDSHAQWEIQQFSDVMGGMLRRIVPIAFEAWLDYEFSGVKLSWGEILCVRDLLLGGQADDKRAWDGYGLSKREQTELEEKLRYLFYPKRSYSRFNLDISKAKPGSFFYEEALAAVPNVDNTGAGS